MACSEPNPNKEPLQVGSHPCMRAMDSSKPSSCAEKAGAPMHKEENTPLTPTTSAAQFEDINSKKQHIDTMLGEIAGTTMVAAYECASNGPICFSL